MARHSRARLPTSRGPRRMVPAYRPEAPRSGLCRQQRLISRNVIPGQPGGRAAVHGPVRLGSGHRGQPRDPPPGLQRRQHFWQVQSLGGPSHDITPLLVELGCFLRDQRGADLGWSSVGGRRSATAVAWSGSCCGGHTAYDSLLDWQHENWHLSVNVEKLVRPCRLHSPDPAGILASLVVMRAP